MLDSNKQMQVQQFPFSPTEMEVMSPLNGIDKEALIAEIERVQNKELIVEIEQLHAEEMRIELSQLKWCSIHKLQQLLRQQNFPHAIASIDSLAQRLPDDTQVREWQAKAYLAWGRKFSKEKNLKKLEAASKKY